MSTVEEKVQQFKDDYQKLKSEINKIIVGQDEVIEGCFICTLAGGHALLEGVPGLGKTKMVRTLAETLDLTFSRIQFTPDLMPADITGTNMIVEDDVGGRHFEFQKGPVFSNILLADEINRATPKTQSALLEAMQEKSVTVAKKSYKLDPPFFVLATQNPLEMEGTYPLPEAQLDRFLFKLKVTYPKKEDLHEIMKRTTGFLEPTVEKVMDKTRILEMRKVALDVPVAYHVQDYAIRLVQATHPDAKEAPEITRKYIRYGASPRGAQALIIAGKIHCILEGRYSVSCDDIRFALAPSLRHRIILNFEGEAEGIQSDDLLFRILDMTREEIVK